MRGSLLPGVIGFQKTFFDAQALLAMLLNEPGGEKVRAVLANPAISVVNLAGVMCHYARNASAGC